MKKNKNNILLGVKGENLASEYLINKGYSILFRNWRFKHKEVDLICKKGKYLIFVEVKTRSTDYFQKPYQNVEAKKQELLAEAANAFIENYSDFKEVRFDVVSIVFKSDLSYNIEHIIEAFIPGLNY